MLKLLETKVAAAAAAGGVGGALSAFMLWVLGVTVWGAPSAAGSADVATAAVPAPVAGLLLTLLPAGLALLAGWLAPHTARPDLTPVVADPVVTPEPVTASVLPAALSRPPVSSGTVTVEPSPIVTVTNTEPVDPSAPPVV